MAIAISIDTMGKNHSEIANLNCHAPPSISRFFFSKISTCKYEKLENISQNYETSVLMLEVVFDLVARWGQAHAHILLIIR